MKTATILIGNSDDKLGQSVWSSFVSDMQSLIALNDFTVHFAGASMSTAPWQNACWVIGYDEEQADYFLAVLSDELGLLARQYNQDSIALVVGTTEFITGR